MSTPYVLRSIDETKILFETHWVIIEVDAVITELFIAHVVSKKEHILLLFFVLWEFFGVDIALQFFLKRYMTEVYDFSHFFAHDFGELIACFFATSSKCCFER